MLRATKADSPRRSKRQYLEGTRPELVKAAWQFWWALQDLNLGPTDYESAALTAELRARGEQNTMAVADGQLRIADCGLRIVGTRSAARGVGRRPGGRIRNPQSPIRN